MNTRGPHCPSEETLAALGAGMPVPEAFEAHVSACAACQQAIAALGCDDPFVARFAGAMRSAPGARAARDEAPPVVPGYTIENELSRGGQGVVYRGTQHETHRPVAIKTILRGVLASHREIARFEREVEIAASLRHPHIVTVFEARAIADGRHVLAMDLIEGVSLSSWASHVPVGHDGVAIRLRLMRDVTRAVQYAHSKGVIHRDLKPANIMVDVEGAPHILDFGLARRGREAPGSIPSPDPRASGSFGGLTLAGVFQGTPAYAAPEQFDGDPALIDVRTDVYALGVMLHELLSGQAPFADSKQNFSLIAASKGTGPLPPASVIARALGRVGIGPDADAVIAKATAVARDLRYASASALADDLDALLRHDAVSPRAGRAYRGAKFIRRHRVGVAAAAIVSLAALGGTVAVVGSSISTQAAREREKRERDRSKLEGAKALAVAHILNELIPLHEANFTDRQSPQRRVLDRLHNSLNSGAISDEAEVVVALHALLAQIYADREEFGYAHVNLSRVVQITTRVYGPDHPETASAIASFSSVLLQRGSVDEALVRARDVLRIREAAFPNGGDAVDAAHDLLAQVHLAAGRIEDAARESELALGVPTGESSAPDSTRHALMLRTLSEVRARQGSAREARALGTASMQELLRVLPDEAPEISRGLRSLARVDPSQAGLARLADTLDHTRSDTRSTESWLQWIAEKEALLGPNNDRIAQSYRTLASVLRSRLELRAAMTAIDRAIEIYSQTRGENSLAVIECLEEKLLTLIYAGDITRDEAVSVAARRLHAVRNSKDDLGDMWIASVWREYAHQLLVSNRFEEAEVELRAAGEFARERLGKGIESTRCPMILAQVRYLKGDHLEALALAQQSYDEALAADPRHNELSWKRSVLACCLVADGQMERAESFINADDIRSFVLTWGQGCAATTHMITDAAARLRTSGRESSARILDDAHAAIDRRPRTLDAPVPFQDFIRESPPVPGKVPGDKE